MFGGLSTHDKHNQTHYASAQSGDVLSDVLKTEETPRFKKGMTAEK